MIVDRSNGKLDEIRAFAEKRGLTKQLQGQLDRLDSGTFFGVPADVILTNDFAPYSLLFSIVPKGKHEPTDKDIFMFGGFIYHGPGDTGVSAPTYSVRIGDLSEGWSTHT